MPDGTEAVVFYDPLELDSFGGGKLETSIYIMKSSIDGRLREDIDYSNMDKKYETRYRDSKSGGTFGLQNRVWSDLKAIPDTTLINRRLGRYVFDDEKNFDSLPYSRIDVVSNLNPNFPKDLGVLYDLESEMISGIMDRYLTFSYMGSRETKTEKKQSVFEKLKNVL